MSADSQVFGRYRLLELLGVGGMAEVFLAKLEGPEGFERRLAIKRILPSYSRNDAFVQMFIDEARLVGHFNHPNIVQIHDFGKIDGSYYISMEFVEGIAIADILSRYKAANMPVPLEVLLEVGIQACRGIDYAHRETDDLGRPLGIIHRDLTPHNILISKKGMVKITDFGIAKASMNTHMTQAGMIKGKVPYMSPEQAMGLPLTHVSDVFSIGIVLYEICTLRRLFEGESDFAILRKVQEARIPSITAQNPTIPPELERIVMKALARDRLERYQWASELEADLTRLRFSLGNQLQTYTLADFVQRFMATQPPRPKLLPKGAESAPPAPAPTPTAPESAPSRVSTTKGGADMQASLSELAAGLAHVEDPLSLLGKAKSFAPEDRATIVLSPSAVAPNSGQLAARPGDDPTVRDTVKNEKKGSAPAASGSSAAAASVAEPGGTDGSVGVSGRTTAPLPPRTLSGPSADPPVTATSASAASGSVPNSRRKFWGVLGGALLLLLALVLALIPRTGSLVLEVSPADADVYLNDEKSSLTDGQLLREGLQDGSTVQIRVKKDGFQEYRRSQIIKAGTRYRIPVKLEALQKVGLVMVESIPPGATVIVDERDTGKKTPVRLPLSAGSAHVVRLELTGYAPKDETFTLNPSEEKSLSVSLQPAVPSP